MNAIELSPIIYQIASLPELFKQHSFDQVAVLTDENTSQQCLPLISELLPSFKEIKISSGEENKTLDTCNQIWDSLFRMQFSRNSLLINLGGGVISDMGSFAASVYKRGIHCAHIPTTLLAMVDASVGNKTGIDHQGIKNSLGTFYAAEFCLIDPIFLKTLDHRQLVSGFVEMLKHGIIADANYFNQLVHSNIGSISEWQLYIEKSIQIKSSIVAKDPLEKGLRKILNFGHTIGHALESYFLDKGSKLLHGEAVLFGMICELYMSQLHNQEPTSYLTALESFAKKQLGTNKISFDKKAIINFIKQDKKNRDGFCLFVLLDKNNKPCYDCACTEKLILEALTYIHG